jgi:hypothetical protein
MHLFKEKRSRRTGPAPRAWMKFLVSLLFVAGLAFHMVHPDSPFAGTETAAASDIIFTSEQPHDVTFDMSPAVPHCHSHASCAFLPVNASSRLRAPESGNRLPGPSRHLRSKIAQRQFRPPRFPAHT